MEAIEKKTGTRIASLDALRGFDMFWIMGGQGLVYAIATALGHPGFKAHFDHVPWDGLNFVDTIFPLFLFIAGVTFPFSVISWQSCSVISFMMSRPSSFV